MQQRNRRGLRDERGATIVELMAAVVIMGVVSIGIFQAALAIGMQLRRDKLVNDMMNFGQLVMKESTASIAGAYEVLAGTNSGGRSSERLEFRLLGARNMGEDTQSRYRVLSERELSITQGNQRQEFTRRWPPLETDRERFSNSPSEMTIEEFSLSRYNDRGTVSAAVQNNLYEVKLVLKVVDELGDEEWSLQREFKRVVYVPNKEIEFRALQQDISQSGTGL